MRIRKAVVLIGPYGKWKPCFLWRGIELTVPLTSNPSFGVCIPGGLVRLGCPLRSFSLAVVMSLQNIFLNGDLVFGYLIAHSSVVWLG